MVGKVANLAQLREMAPDLPFIPVLQAYTLHVRALRRPVRRSRHRPEGGTPDRARSVCRRQAMAEAHTIVAALGRRGITPCTSCCSCCTDAAEMSIKLLRLW